MINISKARRRRKKSAGPNPGWDLLHQLNDEWGKNWKYFGGNASALYSANLCLLWEIETKTNDTVLYEYSKKITPFMKNKEWGTGLCLLLFCWVESIEKW